MYFTWIWGLWAEIGFGIWARIKFASLCEDLPISPCFGLCTSPTADCAHCPLWPGAKTLTGAWATRIEGDRWWFITTNLSLFLIANQLTEFIADSSKLATITRKCFHIFTLLHIMRTFWEVHTVTEHITKVLLLKGWNNWAENQDNKDTCIHLHLSHFTTCTIFPY